MRHTIKRILCGLLTALLLMSLLPTAFAENWPETIPDEPGCPYERNNYNHHYHFVDSANADCTHGGWALYRCIYCGHEKKLTSNALGHDWGAWKTTKEPTCTEKGAKERTCKRCGIKERVDIDPLGHDWGDWKTTKEPTCLDDGAQEHSCRRCGMTEKAFLPALGHIWDSGVITKYPTLTEWGERTFTCQRDPSHTYTEPIPPKGDDSTPYYALSQTVTQTSPIKDAYPNDGGDWSKAEIIWYDKLLTNTGNRKLAIGSLIEINGELFDLNELYGVITWLDPGESIVATSHRRAATEDMIADPANSPYAGRITERYYARGYDYEEYLNNGESLKGLTPVCQAGPDPLEWKIAKPGDEQTGGDAWLALVKNATQPADPNGFQLGETIGYGWEIEYHNADEYPLFTGMNPLFTDVILYDDFALDGDAQGWAPYLQIKNGRVEQEIPEVFGYKHLSGMTFFAKNRYIAHIVTQEDVDRGYFDNYMYLSYRNQNTGEEQWVYSNTVRVPVISNPTVPMAVKTVTSTPQETYYMAGEQVTYTVQVTNNTQETFTDLVITDAGMVIGTIASLAPGETSAAFPTPAYTVTPYDVSVGTITNVAVVDAKNGKGEPVAFMSNTTTVYTKPHGMEGDPIIPEAGISLYKEVLNTPAKGYFEIGEQIDYEITVTNTGKVKIDTAVIRDILKDTDFGIIDVINNLYPGESKTIPFSYVVTQPDVDHGKVINYATAQWTSGGQAGVPVKSNEVISYTQEITGFITEDDGGFDPVPGKPSCKLVLDELGSSDATYTLTHCAVHEATAKKVHDLTANATDAATWETAATLWRMAIEEQYQELYQCAWGGAAAAVLLEHDTLDLFLNHWTDMLNTTAKDRALAAQKLCVYLELYSTELCCALHTAEDPLPDSLLLAGRERADGASYDRCLTDLTDRIYLEQYGDRHAEAFRAAREELKHAKYGQSQARAFERGESLWRMGLDTDLSALYSGTALGKQSIAFARISMDSFLDVRADCFGYLYPNGEEIVAENRMKLVRLMALMLCETVEIPEKTEGGWSTEVQPVVPVQTTQPTQPEQPTQTTEPVTPTNPTEPEPTGAKLPVWVIVTLIGAGVAIIAACVATPIIIIAATKKKKRR